MIVFAKELADHDDISYVMLIYVMYAAVSIIKLSMQVPHKKIKVLVTARSHVA